MGSIANYEIILPLILGLTLSVAANPLRAVDDGAISGVIKQASGQPAAGAIVSAKNVDRGVATTVYSQEGGRYTIFNLIPGKYTVRALGGGLQSESKDAVTLDAGQKMTVDLALTQDQNYRQASTAAHDLTMLPDGKEKVFLQRTCGLCHRMGYEEIVMSRRDRDGWMDIISKMRNHPFGNRGSADITDTERDMLVDYFVKNFNLDVPLLDEKKNMPRQWVTGAATKAKIVEVDLPKGAYPHDVDVDSKGVAWVSERDSGYIDRLDPVTLKYKRYKVPGDNVGLSDAIAIDSKGHAWVLDAGNNALLEFNPDAEAFASYPDKSPADKISANTIRFLPGSVWFTMVGGKKVGKFDTATKQYTLYSANLPPEEKRGGPYGMSTDGAGNLWFPEQDSDTVGKIDVETGKVTTFNPPTPHSIPRRMGTDRDGNPWFAEFSGHNLVKIDYRTGKMTEYPTPTKYSTPYSVDSDNVDNLIWTSECYADQMARFDPSSKTWVEYPFPDHHMSIRRIAVDPTMPNRVWFGEPAKDRVGYIEVPK